MPTKDYLDAHARARSVGSDGSLRAILDDLPPTWTRVRELRLLRREVRERLSSVACELLLSSAECAVEGAPESGASAGSGRVYATVMLTIDLESVPLPLREPRDEASARTLAELLARDAKTARRVQTLARPILARALGVEGEALGLDIELRGRAEGSAIMVDGDAVVWVRSKERRA